MKSILVLLVGLVVSGSAFAQTRIECIEKHVSSIKADRFIFDELLKSEKPDRITNFRIRYFEALDDKPFLNTFVRIKQDSEEGDYEITSPALDYPKIIGYIKALPSSTKREPLHEGWISFNGSQPKTLSCRFKEL